MAQTAERKPTQDGFEVRRVANGLMVLPLRHYDDRGLYRSDTEIHVFGDMTALAAWLLAREAELR